MCLKNCTPFWFGPEMGYSRSPFPSLNALNHFWDNLTQLKALISIWTLIHSIQAISSILFVFYNVSMRKD